MTTGIYKITNLKNNKVYIGQSIEIERRWDKHRCYYKNEKNHRYKLYRAMSKYGLENFTFEIIEECLVDELNEREKYWIQYYDSYNNGYNMTIGGSDLIGANDKTVLQYNSKGELINTFKSAHEAERETGISFTNICKVCRGERPHAGGYIWRYINSNLEVKPIKLNIQRNSIIQQIDIHTKEVIAEFSSLKEAAEKTNSNSVCISRVCKGTQQTANGFFWRIK